MDEDLARFRQAISDHQAGRFEAAEAGYRAVLANREHEEVWGNLGLVLSLTGRRDEAEAALRRAVEIAPANPRLRYNLGNLLWRSERLEAAAEAFERVLQLDPDFPDAALNLGNVRLAQGRFEEGWALYEHRAERRTAPVQRLGFPEWQGEPLAGRRLLVWAEQGYGDQILATRWLAGLDAEVTVACRAALSRLFQQLPVKVLERTPELRIGADYDLWTLMLSLPDRLGATPETTPLPPYFAGEPRGSGRVGLAWQGNALPDPGRSLPEPLAMELLALPGVVSLQPEASGAADFQETADLVAGLELVVSIDTSVAHLAGAMGKRCWLLLQRHARADWRLMPGPARDSFWYPSIETILQPTPGDWAAVVAEVKRRLDSGSAAGF